ncbi:MAG: DUF4260 domain-containing protein [Bacteroidota bacterium]
MSKVNIIHLRLEGLALFVLSIISFRLTPYGLGWYFGLLLLPDLSMLGYLFGPKAGAWCYNIAHQQGIWLMAALAGYYAGMPLLLAAGIIFTGHSAMDRAFGYGLKTEEGFAYTHMGMLNRKNKVEKPA